MPSQPAKQRKYQLPAFLVGTLTQAQYDHWLYVKGAAHARRDRKRGNTAATIESYKIAIHKAVVESEGRDFYTGEKLDWSLAGSYDNEQSKAGRRGYKARFALAPSVDHVNDGLGPADFKICGWRTNDAKSDLTHAEFVALCEKVCAQPAVIGHVPRVNSTGATDEPRTGPGDGRASSRLPARAPACALRIS